MTTLGYNAAPARPMVILTAVSLAFLAICLLWAGFDNRMIDGTLVWAKPLRFSISFTVLFATMALVEPYFSPSWRNGQMFAGIAGAMAASMLLEMIYMIAQAAQMQTAHFNTSSLFTGVMYSLMGVGAVTLVGGVGLMGWAALRDKAASFGPGLRAGVGYGFLLSFVLTMITAGTMSNMAGHFIGRPGPDAAVIPLMGWSASVGDLRPAHFVSLHAMQALPLLGVWTDRQGKGAGLVKIAAVVYAAITLALFVQALMGSPLIRL